MQRFEWSYSIAQDSCNGRLNLSRIEQVTAIIYQAEYSCYELEVFLG